MIETWSQPATWVSLATLSAMEIPSPPAGPGR